MQKFFIIDDFSDPSETTKVTEEKILTFLRKVSTIPAESTNVTFEEYVKIIAEEFNEPKESVIEEQSI